MDLTALSARKLRVSMAAREILRDVDLELPGGAVLGVVGPNGAGKSTLLRALAGLMYYQGEVTWGGVEIGRIDPIARARLRSYLPQGGGVHWPLTVAALTALGRHSQCDAHLPAGKVAIARAMAAADVAQFADRPVTELSGGERARALLARALAAEASLIVADEPAAQLDPRHHWQALHVLRAAAAGGAAVVLALHDLTAAARMCDRVLVLDRGAVVAFGPPTDVLTAELLAAVFGVDAHIGAQDGAPLIVPLRARG